MSENYLRVIQNTTLGTLLTLPHKHTGCHPTGFVVRTACQVPTFSFTLCPLFFCKPDEPLPGSDLHDVIIDYKEEDGDLELNLYTLWERYKESHLDQTTNSRKRYLLTNALPPRKIIIPCLGRKENLIPTLRRLQTIDLPQEGYRPRICIVEHSPFPDLEKIAEEFGCEHLWLLLDPRNPELPIGQFNKALSYDKAFLFTSPAEWYLFHDNDILVPRDFWDRIDKNIQRSKTRFLQPYTHRSLLNTIPEIAQRLRDDVNLADLGLLEDMYYPIIEGAPGGSLYLHRSRYLEVGGHDPNYCWGYGPEDQLFFNKLKLLEPIAYADDPPIEMIHLWHETAQKNNPFRWDMDWFVKIFFDGKTLQEKNLFLESKQGLLKHILLELERTSYNKQQ